VAATDAPTALYTVVFTRLRRDPRTHAYANRRTTEGKSTKEIIRCLKRYVARELFPIITAALVPRLVPRRHWPSGTELRTVHVNGQDLLSQAARQIGGLDQPIPQWDNRKTPPRFPPR
jgi:hypothetical protein